MPAALALLVAVGLPGLASADAEGTGLEGVTPAEPSAQTESASDLDDEGATLNAVVDPRGAATTYYFEYGASAAYGRKAPLQPEAIGSADEGRNVSQAIGGLTEGLEYHFRIVATNELGTARGADKTFLVPSAPTVTTGAAENVDETKAVLTGSIEGHGEQTSYQFEYGTTTSYGSLAPATEEELTDETGAAEASEAITGLTPDTTYHYRLIATNAAGTSVGADQTLTTEVSVLPNDFWGLVWSGNIKQTSGTLSEEGGSAEQQAEEVAEMNALGHSGARMFRLQMYPAYDGETEAETQHRQDRIFELAADRGITILPYFEISWVHSKENIENTERYVEKEIARYGPYGTFWQSGGGYRGSSAKPVTSWEIGNEPNLGKNVPNPSESYEATRTNENGEVESWGKLHEIGAVFASLSAAARRAAKAQYHAVNGVAESESEKEKENKESHLNILLPGLFSTGSTGCEAGGECHVSAQDFVSHMGYESSYNAVSLHPYAFRVGAAGSEHAPEDKEHQLEELISKVESHIQAVRNALTGANSEKPIWVTELGFPVESKNTTAFPPVTPETQAHLIEKAMQMLALAYPSVPQGGLGVEHAFFWNIRDTNGHPEEPQWDWHSGLRDIEGKMRPAWKVFRAEAGENLSWPVPPALRPAMRRRRRPEAAGRMPPPLPRPLWRPPDRRPTKPKSLRRSPPTVWARSTGSSGKKARSAKNSTASRVRSRRGQRTKPWQGPL
ncbi:MAG: fibronectin type III domain-containing protein [Solirubrobacterales bacterium]